MKTIKRIHVNQAKIRARQDQPITIKEYKNNTNANEVDIVDADGNVIASILYRPEHPLSCGARVWIETTEKVVVRR